MFSAALIAFAFVLSLSKLNVNSAPVKTVVPQFCTGPVFQGVCTPLNGTSCTNTPGIQSLILNPDADCSAFPLPNCKFNIDQAVLELFSDTEEELGGKGIQSVQCVEVPGTVNGFTAGSPADIAQEAADFAAANGIDVSPPVKCVEGPVQATPEEIALADANGITLSGPVTCS
ncbi:hypothetical protein MVEN_01879500 [Mycena venus]|uniref:Secreted protein n=1 Tax=Mycena venus TaxID=2733690 RepID=A0A8H7CKU0_9AGAR|nr:hypothetical protein MVEN_01879500 [Mycena venus]